MWCLSAEFLLLEREVEVSNLILPSVFLGFFLLALELPLDFAKLRLGRLGSLPRFCFNLCSLGSVSPRLEWSLEMSEAAFAAETLLVKWLGPCESDPWISEGSVIFEPLRLRGICFTDHWVFLETLLWTLCLAWLLMIHFVNGQMNLWDSSDFVKLGIVLTRDRLNAWATPVL